MSEHRTGMDSFWSKGGDRWGVWWVNTELGWISSKGQRIEEMKPHSKKNIWYRKNSSLADTKQYGCYKREGIKWSKGSQNIPSSACLVCSPQLPAARVCFWIRDCARQFFKPVWYLRWWKWFKETSQIITVTGQINGCPCYYQNCTNKHPAPFLSQNTHTRMHSLTSHCAVFF